MRERLNKFISPITSGGGWLVKEDGYFFVVLTILNLPIISHAEDFQAGALNFWIGAFAIFFLTAITHCLPVKLRRVLQFCLITLFTIVFLTDVFLLYKFGVPLNPDTLQILLGTNPLTAKAFLQEYVANIKILGSLAAFVLVLVALIFGLKRFLATRSDERLKRLFVELIIILFFPIVLCFCATLSILLNVVNNLFLNTTTWYTAREIQSLVRVAPIGSEEKFFAEMDKHLETEKIISDTSDIPFVVFVLGESTDRNHMQLYGYRLPTTPHLSSRYERGEIFRLSDTIACANHTSLAMSRIFTFAEKEDPKDYWYLKANLFDIVRRAGYHTIWLSNQSPLGLWGNFDKYFSARCDEKFFIESEDKIAKQRQVDGVLLPVLDEFLAASNFEKNFYIIHLYGTHEPFKERYPAEFEKFSADDENKSEELWRQITAEYDNAVLYNDFIVDEIIQRFEDKNAVLIYISDHGEEVYDGRDFFGHSVEEDGNVHMIEIPALVWASKEFREHYLEKNSALNAALDRPYRTDYLIHTLLDIMDIHTTSFDETKSIINEKFDSTRPRLYNGKPYVQ